MLKIAWKYLNQTFSQSVEKYGKCFVNTSDILNNEKMWQQHNSAGHSDAVL